MNNTSKNYKILITNIISGIDYEKEHSLKENNTQFQTYIN